MEGFFHHKEMALRERALALLGVCEKEDPAEKNALRYGYYCRMKKHHPDTHPGDPEAHRATALIGEAYAYATHKTQKTHLLEDDALVQSLLDDPVTPLDDLPTYEEWLKQQFYNVSERSIWTY